VAELSAAGIPVTVMFSPLIPGLNDQEMAAVLDAARENGARSASYTMLRLSLTVRPIFIDWLEQNMPSKKGRIEAMIRSLRDGQMNDAQFGARMRGTGVMADQISQLFKIMKKKYRLDQPAPPLDCSLFEPPSTSGQMWLF
jgi:DNA repair photolyase